MDKTRVEQIRGAGAEVGASGSGGVMSGEVLCYRCGYDVRAHAAEGVCPECGASVAESRRVGAIPLRPGWGESDPRWRRRVLAGVWLLVLLPLVDGLQAFGLAERMPVPSLMPAQGVVVTLDQTLMANLGVFPLLAFCVGAALVCARERGRRRGKWDWTRRWGVLGAYLVLLLGVQGMLFIGALVLAGISACFMSMPLRYQPGITRLCVELSTPYLRHVFPRAAVGGVVTAFSSLTLIIVCVALFDALRSTRPRRPAAAAAALLAPLVLFAVMHLAQAGEFFVRVGFLPATDVAHYWIYFWPELLAKRLAGRPLPGILPGSTFAWVVEAIKWGVVFAVAVWLTLAQFAAYRRGGAGVGRE